MSRNHLSRQRTHLIQKWKHRKKVTSSKKFIYIITMVGEVLSKIRKPFICVVKFLPSYWETVTSKNIMVPLVNQFILGYGNASVVSMVGPYLKLNGASELDIGKTFLMAGVLSILGNVLTAKVYKHSYAFKFS